MYTALMGQKVSKLFKRVLTIFFVLTLTACAPSISKKYFPFHHAEKTQKVGFADPKKAKQYQKVTKNLWKELGRQFHLPDETEDNPQVRAQIKWFMKHPEYLRRVTKRGEPYLYYIYEQVKMRNLPAELTLMPMVESAYNPIARNGGSGATGLWQMMPGTASGFGLHINWWYDGRRDIAASTNAALDYLAYLGNFFNGDWLLAMAAYDTGEGRIQRAIRQNERTGKPANFWHLKLSLETQTYVPKVLALATIIKNPKKYPIDLPPIKNAPYLAEIDVGSQIDLFHAAKMADMRLGELSLLNPGYTRWATDPQRPSKLLLPVDKVENFKTQLALWQANPRTTWYRIEVQSNDTLYTIAKKYHTSVATIKRANKLSSNQLRYHQSLFVPDQKTTTATHHFGQKIVNLPESNVIHHIVRPGDTAQSIAHHYHVTVREVLFWNSLGSRSKLIKGQDVVIWPHRYAYARHQSTVGTYKVRKGDTVSRIARHYHVSTQSIINANHIRHNNIRPNQLLRIPAASQHATTKIKHTALIKRSTTKHIATPHHNTHGSYSTYVVKPGDTLYSISHKSNTSVLLLKRKNHLRGNTLHPGQRLVTSSYPKIN